MINGKHFTPASTDLVDSIAIGDRGAAHQLVEARQQQLLQLGKQLINTVIGLETLHSKLIHTLRSTISPQLVTTTINYSTRRRLVDPIIVPDKIT